jgi:hypothetical protein
MLNANNLKSFGWIATATGAALTASFWLAVQSASIAAAQTDSLKVTGDDNTEFVFVDKCKSGAAYRLKAYKITVNSEAIQMYDYQGPRGTGTIQSDVEPRQAKALLCQENKSAWISSGRQSYN